MEKRYQLRKNEYYLSAYYIREHEDGKITLSSFEVDTEFRKIFNDFDEAHRIQRLIFIETGLNFEVELFRKEDYEYED